jgi:hypothetical protein
MVKAELGRTIRNFFKNRSKTLATNPDLINFSTADLADIFSPPILWENNDNCSGSNNFVINEIQNTFRELFPSIDTATTTNSITAGNIQKHISLSLFKQFYECINVDLTQISSCSSIHSLAAFAAVGMLGHLFSEAQVRESIYLSILDVLW